MKRTILCTASAVLLLANNGGCFGGGERPAPVPVLVPVATHCVRASDIPAEPAHVNDQLTGDSGHDIGVVAGSALELRAWGVAMRGMLVACSTDGAHP